MQRHAETGTYFLRKFGMSSAAEDGYLVHRNLPQKLVGLWRLTLLS
jgi:hypothetical protein